MRIVVTGSSGFVGVNLVPALQKEGHTVIGIDRRSSHTGRPDVFRKGELSEIKRLLENVGKVDCLVHLAAAKDDWGISDEEFFRENTGITRTIIEASKEFGILKHVFYSTVSAHGPSVLPATESDPLKPVIAYGRSKVECEELYHNLCNENPEVSVITIRPSVIYGPGNYSYTNIYRLIEIIRTGRFVMVGTGNAKKTTSYIGNLVPATIFLMNRWSLGVKTYIYVDHPVLKTHELVDKIYDILGAKAYKWFVPLWIAKSLAISLDIVGKVLRVNFPVTAARIEKFCTSTNFDASAIRDLGFRQPIDNDDALRETIAWHLKQSE